MASYERWQVRGMPSHDPFPALHRRYACIDFEHFGKLAVIVIANRYGDGTYGIVCCEKKLFCLLHAQHGQIMFHTCACFFFKTLAQIRRAYIKVSGNIAYRQGLCIVLFHITEHLADDTVADIVCLYLLFCQSMDAVQDTGTAFLYGA